MKRAFAIVLVVALIAVSAFQLAIQDVNASPPTLLPIASDSMGMPAGALHATPSNQNTVNITISLGFRNTAGLNSLLGALYTPGSPNYHHWLSPQQFDARFAPLPSTVSSVEEYMASYGASLTLVSGGGTLLSFSASEQQLHNALGVDFFSFGLGGSVYYASSGTPTMPAQLASYVTGIQGLQDYIQFTHPSLSATNSSTYSPPTSPGATPPYNPATIKEAYNFTGLYSRGISGSGVSVSIVTAYAFDNATLHFFDSQFGIAPHAVNQIEPVGKPTTVNLESTLDVEWMTAIIPNATINVVEGPNAQLSTFTQLFSYVVSNNLSSVASTSWGTPESGPSGTATPSSTLNADNNIFKQAAAQGIDFTTASGDFGAYDNTSQLTPDFPSSSPYVTGVGGTWLNLSQSGNSVVRASETAWSKSGGGVSAYFPTPSYQSSLPGPLTLRSRGVPDVSFSAMPSSGYFIYYNGTWLSAGGTSFGAPIWAGILGLENQLRATANEGNLGFANPNLYAVALSSNYSSAFYDITQGNNGYYSAGPGYDLVTGLGSPDVGSLALLLAKIPATPLSVKVSASPTWGDSPLMVSLYANISGGFAPYSVKWYLNGSYNGSGVDRLLTLRGAAVYRFEAEVTDNVSVTATAFLNVTVYSDNNSNPLTLNASRLSGDANLTVSFSSSLSQPVILPPPYYMWSFGDSPRVLNTSSSTATHTFTDGGNFTVLLTAFIPSSSSPRGYFTTQAAVVIQVAPHLKAIILSNRTGGSYPLYMMLTASSYGGTPGFNYSWSYSNQSGSYTSTSGVVFVNFTAVGTYPVHLSVTDSLGTTAATTMEVRVYEPMVLNITVSPSASGVAPFNVTFHATVSGGAGGYYVVWTFDNTTNVTGNPVSYVFNSGGQKQVRVEVSDLAGDVAYANVTISVQSLYLLNLLKGETAFIILGLTIVVAGLISYSISRRRKKL